LAEKEEKEKKKSLCSENRGLRANDDVGFWGGFRKLIVAGKHFHFPTNAKSKNK